MPIFRSDVGKQLQRAPSERRANWGAVSCHAPSSSLSSQALYAGRR